MKLQPTRLISREQNTSYNFVTEAFSRLLKNMSTQSKKIHPTETILNLDDIKDCLPFTEGSLNEKIASIILKSQLTFEIKDKKLFLPVSENSTSLLRSINSILFYRDVCIEEIIDKKKQILILNKNSLDYLYRHIQKTTVEHNDELRLREGQYFLDNPYFRNCLTKNANHLIRLFTSHRIVGLGQSVAWILEQCKFRDQNKTRFDLVAFSGNFYKQNPSNSQLILDKNMIYNTISKDQINSYREYLKQKNLSPDSIISTHSKENPLIIVEHTHSGSGLRSFLHMIFDWAKEKGSLEQVLERLHVHIIVGDTALSSHLPNVNPISLCIKSIQITSTKFVVAMSNSDNFNDRVVPHFAYHEWGTVVPLDLEFNQTNITNIREKLLIN